MDKSSFGKVIAPLQNILLAQGLSGSFPVRDFTHASCPAILPFLAVFYSSSGIPSGPVGADYGL
jgi:hypothetical protein